MVKLGEILERRAGAKAELITHNTTRFAELLCEPGSRPPQTLHDVPLRDGGISIQDIAQLADRNVYGIRTYWQTRGLMRNSKGAVPYSTERIKEPGVSYIDGEIISVEEAKLRAGKYGEEVEERMIKADATEVVQTRSRGSWKVMWLPYNDKVDSIISSKPAEETA